MAQMMNDPTLSSEEKRCLEKFRRVVDDRFRSLGSDIDPVRDLVLADLATCIGLDLGNVHKDGTLLCALWYVILEAIKKIIKVRDMKFPTLDSFLTAYEDRFSSEPEPEKIVLWQTANWMSLLFKMITARKNKGLAMQVIPKVCEGWDAKYITGSGQTKATANRVHVFETEGSVKPNERGRARLKKRELESEEEVSKGPAKKRHRPDKATSEAPAVKKTTQKSKRAGSDFAFAEPRGSVSQSRGARPSNRFQVAGMHQLEEEEEETQERIACTTSNDVKKAFQDWRVAGSSGLLSLGVSTDMGMGDPTDYQRGISWTEIPDGRSRTRSKSTDPFADGLPSLSSFPSIDLTALGGSANDGFLERHGAFSSGELSNIFTGYK